MTKAEWGTKRACPKCNTRFYDLGNEDPVTCIACGNAWAPEPILKSKQTQLFEVAKPAAKVEDETSDDDLDIDAAEEGDAPDVDLGDDDEDLNTVVAGGDEEER